MTLLHARGRHVSEALTGDRVQGSKAFRTVQKHRRRTTTSALQNTTLLPLDHTGTGAALVPSARRRLLLFGAGGSLALGPWSAQPAQALKTVTLKDGSNVEVYEHGMTLSIVALRNTIPSQWLVDYRQTLGRFCSYAYDQRNQLADIYAELGNEKAKRSCALADVVTLGDAWLGVAIRNKLISPIAAADTYRWWRQLPPRWRQLMRRDASGRLGAKGDVYGAPYRWGATLVAYKPSTLLRRGGRPIVDWPDLLQPRLKGRLALPESPRGFLSVVLKSLGLSINTTAAQLRQHAHLGPGALRDRARALARQAVLLSNRDHVRALAAGDVWAIVGWSPDLVALAERTPTLDVLAPVSGTSLWADVWVVPAGARGGHLLQGPSPLLPSWLEFCLTPARASTLPGLRTGASPLLLPATSGDDGGTRGGAVEAEPGDAAGEQHAAMPRHDAQEARARVKLRGRDNYLPPPAVLRASEFLLPPDDDTLELYNYILAAKEEPP